MFGLVPRALEESQHPSCTRCERCGCGIVADPQQIPICSTCAPAEVAELRAKVKELSQKLEQKLPFSQRVLALRLRRYNMGNLTGGINYE